MVEISNLSYRHSDNFSLDLDSLSINSGEINVIIGPNGSGKSTLINIIAGLNKEYEGSVRYNGREIKSLDENSTAKIISYVGPRPDVLPQMTVYDVVQTGRFPYLGNLGLLDDESIKAVNDALESTGLLQLKERRMDTLSSGEAQRTMIARSIAQDTPVLVMDEPVSNIDPAFTYEIIKNLKKMKKNKIIIAVLHDLNLSMTIADKIIGIKNGKCFLDAFSPDLIDEEKLSSLFDVALELNRSNDKLFVSFKDL